MTPRAMHGSAPVLALVLLAAIATSRPWSTHRASAAPPADPSTIVIQVDGRDPSLPASFRRYFPSDVRVHRGDRLTFRHIDSGEPHTVTLGRLVDAGLADGTDGGLAALPTLSPARGQVPPAAAEPCLISSGIPQTEQPCPSPPSADFDGTQSYYNSGWLGTDADFAVTLSRTIPLGTYHFMCLVHRRAMSGSFTVVADREPVPGPAEVSAEGARQLGTLGAGLAGLTEVHGDPRLILAGAASQDGSSRLDAFIHDDITTAVQQPVRWLVSGVHTISFAAPEEAIGLLRLGPDGHPRANRLAIEPTPAGQTQGGATVLDGGSWAGENFKSSGVLEGSPEQPLVYQMRFSAAGTYSYQCLIRYDMKGRIHVVGP